MPATVLLDENVPRRLGMVFADAGYVVLDVRDLGLRGAGDTDVFVAAQERHAILVTRDLGFSHLHKYPLGTHAGIVVFRIPFSPSEALLLQEAERLVKGATPEDLAGALVIVEPRRIRRRRKSVSPPA